MTLPSELLPAMQHYALFAAALALFSLSLTHAKKRFGIWVWLLIVVLPVAQIAWSLWETVSEVVAAANSASTDGQPPAGSDAVLIVVQALFHGLAIAVVLAVVLCLASRSSNKLPRRVRLEPTVGNPRMTKQRAT